MKKRRIAKRVVMMDLETNEPIVVFVSSFVACECLDIPENQMRYRVASRKPMKDWDFYLMFADDWEKENNEWLPGNPKAMINLPL